MLRCNTSHITPLTWLPDTDANMFCKLRRKRLNKNVISITISIHGFVRPRVKRLLREVAPEVERKRRQKQNLRAHLLKKLVNQPVRKSAAWEVKNQETISQKSNEESCKNSNSSSYSAQAAVIHSLALWPWQNYLPSKFNPWNFKAYILNYKIGIQVPQRAAED